MGHMLVVDEHDNNAAISRIRPVTPALSKLVKLGCKLQDGSRVDLPWHFTEMLCNVT